MEGQIFGQIEVPTIKYGALKVVFNSSTYTFTVNHTLVPFVNISDVNRLLILAH